MANGTGRVVLSLAGDRTVATTLVARSPLRLLTPRPPGMRTANVIASSFGGGLVAGDDVRLDIHGQAGTTTYFGTQASTKVYRSHGGIGCKQNLNVTLAADSTLVALPDAVSPFAGSIFEQRQRFELHPSASLVVLDAFTCGRLAHGERWAFESYFTRNDIYVGEKHLLADALRLDAQGQRIDSPHKMGRFDCFATFVLVGPRVSEAARRLLAWANDQPIADGREVVYSASPLATGAIVRVAGSGVQAVCHWWRRQIGGVVIELLGNDPWQRKF